jgi:hypothetical protein
MSLSIGNLLSKHFSMFTHESTVTWVNGALILRLRVIFKWWWWSLLVWWLKICMHQPSWSICLDECEFGNTVTLFKLSVISAKILVACHDFVMNDVTNSCVYKNELELLLLNCRSIIFSNVNYYLAFISRQANIVTYSLANIVAQSSPITFYVSQIVSPLLSLIKWNVLPLLKKELVGYVGSGWLISSSVFIWCGLRIWTCPSWHVSSNPKKSYREGMR